MFTLILLMAIGQNPAAAFYQEPPPSAPINAIGEGMERMDGMEKAILSHVADREARRHADATNDGRRARVRQRLMTEFHYFKWFKLPFTAAEARWIRDQADRASRPYDHATRPPAPPKPRQEARPGVLSYGPASESTYQWYRIIMPDGSYRVVWGVKTDRGKVRWVERKPRRVAPPPMAQAPLTLMPMIQVPQIQVPVACTPFG